MQRRDAAPTENKPHDRPEKIRGKIFYRLRLSCRTPDARRRFIHHEASSIRIGELKELSLTKRREEECRVLRFRTGGDFTKNRGRQAQSVLHPPWRFVQLHKDVRGARRARSFV